MGAKRDLTLAPADESGWPWSEKIIMRGGGIPAAGGVNQNTPTPEGDVHQVTVRMQQF